VEELAEGLSCCITALSSDTIASSRNISHESFSTTHLHRSFSIAYSPELMLIAVIAWLRRAMALTTEDKG
jgi:hypothetical protein